MSISQYAIGGAAVVVAVAVGYAKWTSKTAEVATGKAETAIVKAECSTNIADEVTQSALSQVASLTREVERQKLIAAAEAKKSRQRLDAFNALNRKINNVPNDQNVPVSAHIEHVLDELRSPVSGGAGTGSSDQGGNGGASDLAGRDVSPEAKPAPEAPGS